MGTRPMSQAKVDKNGAVMLPADVRRALGVGPGDSVRFAIDDHGAVALLSGRTIAQGLHGSQRPVGPVPHGLRPTEEEAPGAGAGPGQRTARAVAALRTGDGDGAGQEPTGAQPESGPPPAPDA